MDAHEWRSRADIAENQGHRLFRAGTFGIVKVAEKSVNAEMCPVSGEISFGKAADGGLFDHVSIIDAASQPRIRTLIFCKLERPETWSMTVNTARISGVVSIHFVGL